jgi:hypothetical protein
MAGILDILRTMQHDDPGMCQGFGAARRPVGARVEVQLLGLHAVQEQRRPTPPHCKLRYRVTNRPVYEFRGMVDLDPHVKRHVFGNAPGIPENLNVLLARIDAFTERSRPQLTARVGWMTSEAQRDDIILLTTESHAPYSLSAQLLDFELRRLLAR